MSLDRHALAVVAPDTEAPPRLGAAFAARARSMAAHQRRETLRHVGPALLLSSLKAILGWTDHRPAHDAPERARISEAIARDVTARSRESARRIRPGEISPVVRTSLMRHRGQTEQGGR